MKEEQEMDVTNDMDKKEKTKKEELSEKIHES